MTWFNMINIILKLKYIRSNKNIFSFGLPHYISTNQTFDQAAGTAGNFHTHHQRN